MATLPARSPHTMRSLVLTSVPLQSLRCLLSLVTALPSPHLSSPRRAFVVVTPHVGPFNETTRDSSDTRSREIEAAARPCQRAAASNKLNVIRIRSQTPGNSAVGRGRGINANVVQFVTPFVSLSLSLESRSFRPPRERVEFRCEPSRPTFVAIYSEKSHRR